MKGAPLSRRDRLRQMLADLHMPGALEALDAILHGVDGATLTAAEAIEQLLDAQIQLRNNRRLQAAMRSSRLPAVKRLTEFDFSFQPSLRREQMESLHELGFVERRENVVFLAAGRWQDPSRDQPGDRRRAEWPARLLRHARRSNHLARGSAGRWSVASAPQGPHASGAARRGRDRLSPDQSDGRDALLSADDPPLRACRNGANVQQRL
jgi:hypothetical protein